MDEQDLNSVEDEIASQETDQNVSQQDDQALQAEAQAREAAKERDWRAMRQRQKELELEIQRRDEILDRILKSQNQGQPAKTEVVEPEDPDDDYIPAGKVKGIARKAVQPLERQVEELKAELAQQKQEKLLGSLRTKYSDFDDVVNVETLEMLEKNEPELAATIAQLKDPYKMGLHSYKYIKALGLVEKLPDARHAKEVVKKMEKNAKTVQSPTSYDKRPMAQAFKTVGVDNKALYEEMMFYAGQANGL